MDVANFIVTIIGALFAGGALYFAWRTWHQQQRDRAKRPELKSSMQPSPAQKWITHNERDHRAYSFSFCLTNDGSAQASAPSLAVGIPSTWKTAMEIDKPPYRSTTAHTSFHNAPIENNYRTVMVQLSTDRPIHQGDTHQVILSSMFIPAGAHVVRWRATCGDLVFPPGGDFGDYDFEVTENAFEQGRETVARNDGNANE